MIELESDVFTLVSKILPAGRVPDDFNEQVMSEIEILGKPPSQLTPEECRDIGMNIGNFLSFRINEIQNGVKSNDVVSNSPEKNSVYFALERYMNKIRQPLHQCVDELHIRPDAKRYIQGHVDQAVIDLWHPDPHEHQSILKDGRIHINLNVSQISDFSQTLNTIFRDESNFEAMDGYIVFLIGHELGGHGGDHALQLFGRWDNTPSTIFGDRFMYDYPFRWDPTSADDSSLMQNVTRWAKQERFADYFGLALVAGLGFPTTIMNDIIRMKLSEQYETGLTMGQTRKVIDGLQSVFEQDSDTVSPTEWYIRNDLLSVFYKRLYKNNAYPLMVPFSRQSVESIITMAWSAAT